jgi:predicted ATPase
VAKSIADARDLVCLDELHVTDLVRSAPVTSPCHIATHLTHLCHSPLLSQADGLILSRLCQALLQHGVRLVFTSNQPPSKLFESGSNRTRYVGVLAALLRANCVPIKVGTEGVDYRALASASAAAAPPSLLKPAPRQPAHRASGQFLAGEVGRSALEAEWECAHSAAGGEQRASVPIAFARRWSLARTTGLGGDGLSGGIGGGDGGGLGGGDGSRHSNAARVHFPELCAGGRGAADYLALAKQFETLFVEDVPALSQKSAEEARRLITLVDVCYDEHTRIVLHSLGPREQLFSALRDGRGGERARGRRAALDDLEVPEQTL